MRREEFVGREGGAGERKEFGGRIREKRGKNS